MRAEEEKAVSIIFSTFFSDDMPDDVIFGMGRRKTH